MTRWDNRDLQSFVKQHQCLGCRLLVKVDNSRPSYNSQLTIDELSMRIGIFGGSFDPIHLGHLILAERCREKAGLDQVWFMPCSLAPHKQDGAHGTDRQRTEMIELAIGGHEAFCFRKLNWNVAVSATPSIHWNRSMRIIPRMSFFF